MNINQAQDMSTQELVALSPLALMQLQQQAAQALEQAKQFKDWIDGIIGMKYETQLNELRLKTGKTTGTVHINDSGIDIECDLPKKPEWDQSELARIAEVLRADGEDPAEYIDINYKVQERKFTNWPFNLREQFAPARTLKTGKPVYRLAPREVA